MAIASGSSLQQTPAGKFSEAIEKARQAALDVLKPTPALLQRGLELHAASRSGSAPRPNWPTFGCFSNWASA
jgi:hypothetical protein